jgi:aryl-alcohol dehydrogenase-like predicted oxidoreductase
MAPGLMNQVWTVMNNNDPKIGPEISRRGFLKGAAIAGVSAVIPTERVPAAVESGNESTLGGFQAQKRPLGRTGLECSILGMGGFHLGAVSDQAEVNNMVAKAIDHGINIFDNAWEYHKGLSEEKLGTALKGKRDNVIVMSAFSTHTDRETAMRMLEASLNRLQTDHLDVWQIHEVIFHNDPELIYARDSVLEALARAKQQGKVRFVGFNGHKHPAINLEMLTRGYAFDVVQMPLNPLDPGFRSFENNVLPVANRRGVAVLGMKSMGGSGESIAQGALTPSEALSYAMSLPVATTISGIDSMGVLDQNLAILRDFTPLSDAQMQTLRNHCKQFNDGRFELYKSTMKYDSDLSRSQHGYPSAAELPL